MATSYQRFVIRRPAPLPCSRLYSLEPVGVGTPLVESLTGYIARLADAHLLSVSILFGHILAPLAGKEYLRRAALRSKYLCRVFAGAFRPSAPAMNGSGVIACDWMRIMQKLTLRSDLRFLTLLTWGAVLSRDQLLRPFRAWCPVCYRDWRARGKPIYEPLLWAVKTVSVCPLHERPLHTLCPHCGRSLHPLASRSRPGHCSSCGGWLGETSDVAERCQGKSTAEEIKRRVWEARAVGELLAAAPHLTSLPMRESVVKSSAFHLGLFKGRLPILAQSLGLNKATIWRWYKGDGILRLDSLLRLCYSLEVSPLDFLTGSTIGGFSPAVVTEPALAKEKYRTTPRQWKPLDEKEAERVLQATLKEYPPPTLQKVASRLGRDGNTIRYRFPEACRMIVKRHNHYKRIKYKEKWQDVENTMRRMLAEEPPPSMAEVARRLGCDVATLKSHYLSLCRAISERHVGHNKVRKMKLRTALKELLGKSPPPSLLECARLTGVSKSNLYKHYPNLCHRISSRRRRHREISKLKESNLPRAMTAGAS